MSGIFHHAASLGYINVNVNRINVNVNPIKLAKVLTTQAPPEETAHYTVPLKTKKTSAELAVENLQAVVEL
jgi:hypothetical protein